LAVKLAEYAFGAVLLENASTLSFPLS
jgi:hypothetical protein